MIRLDEEALICDLAETYNIYDYKSLPVKMVAIFSIGLRNNSRIKLKMRGMKESDATVLLAKIYDGLQTMCYDGKGEAPQLIAEMYYEKIEDENKAGSGYASPEEFEAARNRILKG